MVNENERRNTRFGRVTRTKHSDKKHRGSSQDSSSRRNENKGRERQGPPRPMGFEVEEERLDCIQGIPDRSLDTDSISADEIRDERLGEYIENLLKQL